ncbi:MAG TPA: SUMF1/EgtB/PvdO family nonheme iron enzyme [Desulfomonilaceae bacterium]|nr:SUMF1/EgtB/PvdO family nonheme iron enzyme [Desulfomonilaceae bacterium]
MKRHNEGPSASQKAVRPHLFTSTCVIARFIKKNIIIIGLLGIVMFIVNLQQFSIGMTNEIMMESEPSREPASGPTIRTEKSAKNSGVPGGLTSLDLMTAAADARQGAEARESKSVPIAEKVRQAGAMIVSGDPVRAKEILEGALRECESGDGNARECSDWLESLRGLNGVLAKPTNRIVTTNSIGMNLVRIPAGEYMMGSPKRDMDWLRLTFKKTWREGHKQWFQDELPLHPVRITRPFYMAATTVTVGQFRQFIKETSYKTDAEKGDGAMIFSKTEGRWVPRKEMKWDSTPWKIADNQPVVFVSWNDAQAFCRWLSRKEKRNYRLPTEAEWEMCCRGGSVWVRYPWGNRLPGDRDMNFGDGNPKLPESLTTVDDGYEFVAPVGSYPPNGFGLYDMDGNVMQWVSDYYSRNYFDESPLEDPQGPGSGTSRVNKGGNWFASPADCRCAFRGFSGPEMSFWNLGFRVVMEEDQEDKGHDTSKIAQSPQGGRSSAVSQPPPSDEEGMRLFREAMLSAQQQQWDNAIDTLESALKLYEKREDSKWVPRVRATLAGIYAERNRIYKSKELYTEALAEFRKIGDTASARVILARLQELEASPGVKVVQVKKGGLAERISIVPEDVIIEYAGETGFRVSGFQKLVEDYSRAEEVTLSLFRNGEITTLVVPGGSLGVAVEDIKRPPRPRRPAEEERPRERPRPRSRPARR